MSELLHVRIANVRKDWQTHGGLIIGLFLLLCACEKPPAPQPAQEQPTFIPPSATEAFNLRTKCAELTDKIGKEHDFSGADVNQIPPFTQERSSHYDPKTNRCYVQIRVTAVGAVVLSAMIRRKAAEGNRKGAGELLKSPDALLEHFDVDYEELHLYDGQTGEELAFSQKGVRGSDDIGIIGLKSVPWHEAHIKIGDLMADAQPSPH